MEKFSQGCYGSSPHSFPPLSKIRSDEHTSLHVSFISATACNLVLQCHMSICIDIKEQCVDIGGLGIGVMNM